MPRPTPYSAEEIERMHQLYPVSTPAQLLAAFPNRSYASIRCLAGRLQVFKNEAKQLWDSKDDEVLKARYHEDGPQRLAKKLGRSPQGVKRRAHRLGLTSRRNMAPRPDRARRAPGVAPTTVHNPSRSNAHTLRPLAVGAQIDPVKRSPHTPILNANKAAKQRIDGAKKVSLADEIKALPANSEGRLVYQRAASLGGAAATAAFREWQQQQQIRVPAAC